MVETELTPLQAETMKMIIVSGNLLVCVVNDVLDYSKLQSGFVDVQQKRSNLQDVTSSTARCVQLKSKGGVTIETFLDPQIPEHVTTDSRRLQQILFNLLGMLLCVDATAVGRFKIGGLTLNCII